jgi:AraC-like DNA-binding protein
MEQLARTLERLYSARRDLSKHLTDAYIFGGMETRMVPSQYYWDGLKRGGDPEHPTILFQYTLDGWGIYADGNDTYKVLPGMAFTAVIPSEHQYYLPPESPSWTFFWLFVRHPYAIARMQSQQKEIGPVLTISPGEMLMSRAIQLFEGFCNPSYPDKFAEELAVFEFLIEYERFGYRMQYSAPERERLLNEIRSYVIESLRKPIEVIDLAALYNMSRSHFSHHFKATTGLAPAQYIAQIRLEEATHRLLRSDLKLEAIAAETGYANANHFCKVFRKHYYLSPGEFRRQMRSELPSP